MIRRLIEARSNLLFEGVDAASRKLEHLGPVVASRLLAGLVTVTWRRGSVSALVLPVNGASLYVASL